MNKKCAVDLRPVNTSKGEVLDAVTIVLSNFQKHRVKPMEHTKMSQFLSVLILVVFSSCSSKKDNIEAASTEAGALTAHLVPTIIQDAEADSKYLDRYRVGFMQSARWFYIIKNRTNALHDRELIEWGIKNRIPLSVTFKEPHAEIVKVKKASKKVVEEFRKRVGDQNNMSQ